MPEGDGYVPSGVAQGPWGRTMAGHVVGGILGWAVERAAGDPQWQPARLTVDLFRPTALEHVAVAASVTRDGRRIRVAEAMLTQRDTVVARASAVFLRRGEQPDQQVWSAAITMPPLPEHEASLNNSPFHIRAYGWGPDTARSGDGAAESEHAPGPKYVWVRETRRLIEAEPLTPFVRAAMAGDVTNPLTHWGTRGMRFINVDYTLTLSRLPDGADVGLAALTHYSHDGVATGAATLFDEHGPIGSSIATALADSRFRPPLRQ
ncbi:MAG: hypothetical protein QOE41_4795 [Mycobacterium sp.]|nr:hypothetical protein [Mycobacterium sp.]